MSGVNCRVSERTFPQFPLFIEFIAARSRLAGQGRIGGRHIGHPVGRVFWSWRAVMDLCFASAS